GVIRVTLSNDERGNQLRVRVQGDERPYVADSGEIIPAGGVLSFLPDEPPYLIDFDVLTAQAAHFAVHDLRGCLTHTNAQAHDRVAVNAGDALNGADAVALT